MSITKKLIVGLFMSLALAFVMGCESKEAKQDAQGHDAHAAHAAEPAPAGDHSGHEEAAGEFYYECPMKCEGKTFEEPGKCPVCGMDLQKVEGKKP